MHGNSGIRGLGKDWNYQGEFIESRRLEMRLQGLTSRIGEIKTEKGSIFLEKGEV